VVVTDSFDLKLARAEHHLVELNREIRRFANRDTYEAVAVAGTNRKTRSRKFRLRFTEQPSQMLPMIVGDIIHNVRSALDHLVVANVPPRRRRSAGFPIFSESPFGADGEVLDNELGATWVKLTSGLRKPLLTQLHLLQPYQVPGQDVIDFCIQNGLDPSDIHSLRILSRLDNADKHRELLTVAHGLENADLTIRIGTRKPITDRMVGFVEDGAQLIAIDVNSIPRNAKVGVQVHGTVRVAIEVRKERGVSGLPKTLERMIGHAREIVAAFQNL
jgi:hypothetical protein